VRQWLHCAGKAREEQACQMLIPASKHQMLQNTVTPGVDPLMGSPQQAKASAGTKSPATEHCGGGGAAKWGEWSSCSVTNIFVVSARIHTLPPTSSEPLDTQQV